MVPSNDGLLQPLKKSSLKKKVVQDTFCFRGYDELLVYSFFELKFGQSSKNFCAIRFYDIDCILLKKILIEKAVLKAENLISLKF